MSTDKRSGPRRRVLLSDMLVFDGGARTVNCSVRDLSDSGAKIELGGVELLPRSLWLIEMRAGVARECRVTWARGRQLGLEFIAAHDLQSADTPDLQFMRRLWIESVAR